MMEENRVNSTRTTKGVTPRWLGAWGAVLTEYCLAIHRRLKMKNWLVIALACSIPATTAFAAKKATPPKAHGQAPILTNRGKLLPASDLSVCPPYSLQGGL